ncbi:MAG TPA: hypothetical protein VNT81_17865 [Vicinamibacterales bacterium]|nr:hypothetical protein [Vicinamibacterales bacterium]
MSKGVIANRFHGNHLADPNPNSFWHAPAAFFAATTEACAKF